MKNLIKIACSVALFSTIANAQMSGTTASYRCVSLKNQSNEIFFIPEKLKGVFWNKIGTSGDVAQKRFENASITLIEGAPVRAYVTQVDPELDYSILECIVTRSAGN